MAAGALVAGARGARRAVAPQYYAPERRAWCGTPEIYFTKPIDNSRLVKVADPAQHRERVMFVAAITVLLVLMMGYVWQHFSAIEYGYRIEALRSQRENLIETNRALRLEEASLRDPERIDTLARQMGLQAPQAGQLVRLEPADNEPAGPVLARASAQISVVSLTQ
jgi:cell division protein FtsL